MSTDNNKDNKDEIVKANILALPKNSSSLVKRALQDINILYSNPQILVKPITKINLIDSAEMVWVPGGTFTMGSPEGGGSEDEHPAHQVTLSGYWIYKYEVTVAQYCAFCAANSRKLPDFPIGYSWEGKSGWNDPALRQHPIVNVSWDDCKAYADWAGVNLTTEAQWEYAARGLEGRNYPWGGIAISDDLYNGWDKSKCANYDNSMSQNISTWPVGSFPAGASWCDAQDLAGNVWEWCADWHGKDYYKTAPTNNPTGPKTGNCRVLRGGSWGNGIDYYRGAFRNGYGPYNYYGYYFVGFRCASPEIDVLTTKSQISELNDNIIQIKETEQTLVAAPLPITKINPIRKITRSLQDFYKSILKSQQTTKINQIDGAEMVWVPGGTFTMGSPESVGDDDERPAHRVTLSGYWIYKYPVTVAQYCTFCAATSYKLPEFPTGYSWAEKSGWNDPALRLHPIVNVTWVDSNAYADWAGTNLPTEAQWEYAARGKQGRNFPWGGIAVSDDLDNLYNGWDQSKCANYKNSRSQNISTRPVGFFPSGVSWCGTQDMAGNVWEWCADWYDENYYKTVPTNNPTGPKTGKCRVLRGGSWIGSLRGDFRGACRGDDVIRGACRGDDVSPYYYYIDIGFRCASPGP